LGQEQRGVVEPPREQGGEEPPLELEEEPPPELEEEPPLERLQQMGQEVPLGRPLDVERPPKWEGEIPHEPKEQ